MQITNTDALKIFTSCQYWKPASLLHKLGSVFPNCIRQIGTDWSESQFTACLNWSVSINFTECLGMYPAVHFLEFIYLITERQANGH